MLRCGKRLSGWVLSIGLSLWAVGAVRAEEAVLALMSMSLEELMDVEVVSVAKKEQRRFESAAPVAVITREEIRRSGVTSIPEALRLAPGLQVARLDASKWALTARGFNGRYANKLLVMIDGRSIYTPLFAGVWWREYDVLLEDVERIEVVRGPGATLWGANAVNGIIHIITRNAADTQGGVATAGAGSEERGFGSARYGGRLENGLVYRLYGRYFDRDGFVDATGEETADRWEALRGGFRMDWAPTPRSALSLQGELADGEAGQTYAPFDSIDAQAVGTIQDKGSRLANLSHFANAFLLGRWQHRTSECSELALQIYYDRIDHDDSVVGAEVRNTLDVDFQQQLVLGPEQELLWGARFRISRDRTRTATTATLEPTGRTDRLFSAFAQSDVELAGDRLRLILGTKLAHNGYTGFEIQPGVRLLWRPGQRYRWWGAISRAVRTPSRAENDARVLRPVGVSGEGDEQAVLAEVRGNRNFASEEMVALEMGGRFQQEERLSLDLAVFCNLYDRLRTLEPGAPFVPSTPPLRIVFPFSVGNEMDGKTFGLEVEAIGQLRPSWRVRGTYTFLEMRLELDPDSGDSVSEEMTGYSPRQQIGLWSNMDLPGRLELDAGGRYVSALESMDVEGYFSLDARLGWQPRPGLRLSLAGQNLLEAHHAEFAPELLNSVTNDTQRGVYGKVTWEWKK